MYEGKTSIWLKITELLNLAAIMLFLVLFAWRFCTLRRHSSTNRYRHYFPKMRTLLSVGYVVLAFALLIYNIVTNSYTSCEWYKYVLQGGGGECINAGILLVQLGVLRQELLKQQPYTPFHIAYFGYLALLSLARAVLVLKDFFADLNTKADLVISSLLFLLSAVQLAYWVKKRQSLPQFIAANPIHIQQMRHTSEVLIRRRAQSKRSFYSSMNDDFPYLAISVGLRGGNINVALERVIGDRRQTSLDLKDTLNDSFLLRQSKLSPDLVTVVSLTPKDLQTLYTVCGRLPLQSQITLDAPLPRLISQLQRFLDELFRNKRYYQVQILKFFKLPEEMLQTYEHLSRVIPQGAEETIDPIIGIRIPEDRNAILISVTVYRHLWVHNHYQLYMKVSPFGEDEVTYPIIRHEHVMELHKSLKQIIRTENMGLELPAAPKSRSIFAPDPDQISQLAELIQKYLRAVANDPTLLEQRQIRERVYRFLGLNQSTAILPKSFISYYRDLTVAIGEIQKALVNSQYVMFYEFKIQQGGHTQAVIHKRYSDFQALLGEIQKWHLNNKRCGINDRLPLTLPDKILYKPEVRHEDLRALLQTIVRMADVSTIYPVHVFLNAGREHHRHQVPVINKRGSKEEIAYSTREISLSQEGGELEEEEEEQHTPEITSSRIFNKMLDDLGNQQYD